MQPRRGALYPCYLLHRRDYSNTSFLVEIFFRDFGRLTLIAKGAKTGRDAAQHLLQPFTPLLAALAGRGEVRTLTNVEPAGRLQRLEGRSLLCGFYLNELLMRLMPRGDPHENLFDHYQAALDCLGDDWSLEHCLRQFELRMLTDLGYALTLDREALTDRPVVAEDTYDYVLEQGVVPSRPNRDNTESIPGALLLDLARGTPLTGQAARTARHLMRRIIDHHLGGKLLKSRELFR